MLLYYSVTSGDRGRNKKRENKRIPREIFKTGVLLHNKLCVQSRWGNSHVQGQWKEQNNVSRWI